MENFLHARKLCLESLEARMLLAVLSGGEAAAGLNNAPVQFTASGSTVESCVIISTDIPAESEIGSPDSVGEVTIGDMFYVSVYVKSTDSGYGVTGGYCSLYYDPGAFIPGNYIESPLFSEQTINDGYSFSCGNYISAFGGIPNSMSVICGKTLWVLVGTQGFTADAVGEYEFASGPARNGGGIEKANYGFTREDFALTGEYGNPSSSQTLSVVPRAPETVQSCIAVTRSVPGTPQVSKVESLSEVSVGDTFCVSVYVKSTDSNYGIVGGYCALYYDVDAFTAGNYIESPLFSEQTISDGYDYSENDYISIFGGIPSSAAAAYGETMWVLVGTQRFTADAIGEYEFAVGPARDSNGIEKANYGFVREDFASTGLYGNPSGSLTLSVAAGTLPVIEDVILTDYIGVYDGQRHTIAVSDPYAGTDTILYSADGVTYSPSMPTCLFGEDTVYVKVSRGGYQDWYGSASVSIGQAPLTVSGTSVADKVYDGDTGAQITLGAVGGIVAGDDLTVIPSGSFSSSAVGEYQVPVTYAISGDDADYYIVPAAETFTASITPAEITNVALAGWEGVYDGAAHTITVSDPSLSTDTVRYSADGTTYNLTKAPVYTAPGSYTVYVKVTRANHNDWYGSAAVVIHEAAPGVIPVESCISVTGSAPNAVQVDHIESLSEVGLGDVVYVSVYVRSTDSNYGIFGGYCSLNYDAGGFTPMSYIESAIFCDNTVNDGYDYSADGYITCFGGSPTSMTAAYGQTQWVLIGTQSFTADSVGSYEFSTGMARNRNGVERENFGFVREDFVFTGEYANPAASITIDVVSAVLPEIEDVTLTGWTGVYDGNSHTVTVSDPRASTDTILYSANGIVYSAEAPAFDFGSATVYVKVSRGGYQDWYGSASVKIDKAALSVSGTAVSDKVYDGNTQAPISLGIVSGIVAGDDVSVTASGAFSSPAVGQYNVPVTYTLSGEDAGYYLAPSAESYTASIIPAEITDIALSGWNGIYDGAAHSITVDDPLASSDTIRYSTDGVTYSRIKAPSFTDPGSYTVYVKVTRANHNVWYGSAAVVINDDIPSQTLVDTRVVVSTEIPVLTEVDILHSVSEVALDSTLYVSVYVKSTDSRYGITSGYCSLYYDVRGFTPLDYLPSALFPNDTINHGYDYSSGDYISAFGGTPFGMTDAYGQTQWALVGTQSFRADAVGGYVFSNGVSRNQNGEEKESWSFVREDWIEDYNNNYNSVAVTVVEAFITDVDISGWSGTYDGQGHSVTLIDGHAETDTILYTCRGVTYTALPEFTNVGTYTVDVRVRRPGHQDWTGSADIVITPAEITDITLSGWEGVYDGKGHSITVDDALAGTDTIRYIYGGAVYDDLPVFTNAGTYTVTVQVSRENFYDWTGSAVVTIKTPLPKPAILTGTKGIFVSHGANRHEITWSSVDNAIGYELSYRADGSSTWTTVKTTETSAVVARLTYGADMTYRVRALGENLYADSDWSVSKSFLVCPMDINNDGDIAVADRTQLTSAWLSEEGDDKYHYCCDINGDGDVSGADRNFLSQNWLSESDEDGLYYPRALRADAVFAEFASGGLDIDFDEFF